jgi:uncharacterized protein YdhG (YjbR/CyaY superfamily)
MSVMMKKPTSIDDYLRRVSPDKRAALQKLRRAIKAVIPKAEEIISYQIPAFRLDGRVVVWFGASAKHCAFYPGAHPIAAHKGKLAKYKTSRGTIRFQPDQPLPASLVRTLVKTRIEERAGRAG